MRPDFLLHSDTARELYASVRNAPIYDYHCHLSPKEIWEDRRFGDVTGLMLDCDHYKWRLMRSAGVPEYLITGHRSSVSAGNAERFEAYAGALEFSAGNPLYHWTQMELEEFFGISEPLTAANAAELRARANKVIEEKQLSPRRILTQMGVKLVVTTDDPADDLEYHRLFKGSGSTDFEMLPAFRPDRVLLLDRIGTPEGFRAYIEKLGNTCGAEIFNLATLKEALERRLQSFCQLGCRFADIGIPFFPRADLANGNPERAFLAALSGDELTPEDYNAYLWDMFLFLGGLCHDLGVLLQLHIAVLRNVNTRLFRLLGPDAGGDAAADCVPLSDLALFLDTLNTDGALPDLIVYSLNPNMTEPLTVLCGSFRDVKTGAAWWFNDHEAGIRSQLEIFARQGSLASFFGMLTDSRSFLSYVRHGFFRRIAADLLGGWVENGEFSDVLHAKQVLKAISGENVLAFLNSTH